MKNLVRWMITLALVITALVTQQLGYISDGVINLLLVAAWLHGALIICMGFALFDDEKLKELAERLKKAGRKPWQGKLQSWLVSLIGCTFIYFGYWITGGVWLIAAIISSVVMITLHQIASSER
ncbi:TPA: hypothetical protein NKU90_000395 [Vibrio parahaemolyticus]|uniref:hypothetical protein n=1 Tax=Vibrio parahaemolyticus TaxID=670 RepID=UPI0007613B3B|nr:hypothetical protein [Vibrio parahaemolyticus]KWU38721.1 hypothetical protein AVL52_02855 [Vibrio parahaemolyticus]MCZ6285985.1 hypothetical protein [Vibrio parahaemolyticus]HBC3447593.1 hypothetical protein [Vibrio parahaemolyticus]HCE4825306.1 hypothetical protein [Vibrio parahaemolyticus]HCG8119391.1 hypothetical protein [Vibrio parahaemolyticus]